MNIGAENQIPAGSNTLSNGKFDPFNYPSLNRKDLMSLSTIDASKDQVKTRVNKFVTKRDHSQNMITSDIDGKLHSNRFT